MMAKLSIANAVVHSANFERVKFAAITSLVKARDIDVGKVTVSMQFHSVLVSNVVKPIVTSFCLHTCSLQYDVDLESHTQSLAGITCKCDN